MFAYSLKGDVLAYVKRSAWDAPFAKGVRSICRSVYAGSGDAGVVNVCTGVPSRRTTRLSGEEVS